MTPRHWADLPEKAGRYCVSWDGWKTFVPVFMVFDGEVWQDLDQMRFHFFKANSREEVEQGLEQPGEFYWYPNE